MKLPFILALLLLLFSITGVSVAGIYVDKYVYPDSESYSFSWIPDIDPGSRQIKLTLPQNKKVVISPTGPFQSLSFGREDMPSIEDLERLFPIGRYRARGIQKRQTPPDILVSYDFPSIPEITYPENGSNNIPTSFQITWLPLSDPGEDIQVSIQDADDNEVSPAFMGVVKQLSSTTTSVDIPPGVLHPGRNYRLAIKNGKEGLGVTGENGGDLDIATIRVLFFSTALLGSVE